MPRSSLRFAVPVDPETRRAAARTLAALRRSRRVVLTAHKGPDGDGLGSILALAALLRGMGKSVQAAADGGVPARLAFLPGAAAVIDRPGRRWGDFDTLVVVDSGSFDRVGWVGANLPPDATIINIDHHASNTRFGSLNWVEPHLGSVGEMVYRLVRAAGSPLSRELAIPLYVAMVSDNGSFQYSSTGPYSHLIAADLLRAGVRPDWVTERLHNSRSPGELKLLAEAVRRMRTAADGRIAWTSFPRSLFARIGATPDESQEYVSLLRSVRGTALSMLLRETSEPGRVKVSLRGDGSVNCNHLARQFGGGGHARAAGCTIAGRLKDVERRVVAAAVDLFAPRGTRR